MAKVNVKELRAKIAARKAEREAGKTAKVVKYAKMKAVATKAPEKLEKHLIGLADKFAAMAEGIENLRENLGLVRAAKEAPLKTRIAAAKNYGKTFRRIAEEAPEKMEEALREAYEGLNDIAADIEMAAEQMGVSLEAPASSFDEAGEYHDEFNAPAEEVEKDEFDEKSGIKSDKAFREHMEEEKEEEPEEEKEASGSDAWVTDRDESGEPKAPVVAASGSDAFVTDRDKDGKPEAKEAANKEAMSRKDFILIADAIREFSMPTEQRRQLAEHFAKYLRGTNYNFMSGRFVAYCMGEGGSHGGTYKGEPPANKDILFEGVPTQEESMATKSKRPLGL